MVLRQRLRCAGALWSRGERRAVSVVNPNLIRSLQERVNFVKASGGFKRVPARRWKEGFLKKKKGLKYTYIYKKGRKSPKEGFPYTQKGG